jgi:hypothetical protein
MNFRISALITWPGTRIGKPGGYGMTNSAETRSRPPAIASAASSMPMYSQLASSYDRKKAWRIWPSRVCDALPALTRKAEWNDEKSGSGGCSRVSERTRLSWMRLSIALMSATRWSTSRAIFTSTSSR